jgi:acetolactate synthase small subunit
MKVEAELFTLRLKVVDKPGVLVRVALVFSRRGRNVSTLLVSPSLTPDFSSFLSLFTAWRIVSLASKRSLKSL